MTRGDELIENGYIREWVFRPEVKLDSSKEETHDLPPTRPAKPYKTNSRIIATSHHTQTPVSLFRFSALTFNGQSGRL